MHEHVLWLRANKLISLLRLFAVAHDDPEYNEQSKQGVFYAESWALVHLLLLGDQTTHGTQLTEYIDRLHQGQSPKEALAMLGDLGALQKQLESYVRRNAFTYRNEAFKDGDVAVGVAFQPLSREDTLFRLGDLLLHTSELQAEAAEHFRAALAVAPKHGGALGGLALIEAEAGRWAQAVPGFEAAVAATPDDPELRLRLAQALYQAEFQEQSRPAEGGMPQRLLLARPHAAKAVALRPDTFDSQFLLGLTYAFQGKDVEPGITALERAHALAPGRSDVLLALGGLQMRAAHWDDAKASLAEVARSASEPMLAAQARESMAEIAVTQAFEEFNRTHDAAKAATVIRAALPDLDPQRRVEAEDHLARLKALRAGTIGSIDEVTKPPMDSDDLDAHLRFGAQQGRASQRVQGEPSERLAKEAVQHFRRAAEIDATSDEAWLGLAAACATARCPGAEGKQAAEKGLELKPGDLQGTYLLAHYCIEGEEYARARELLLPILDVEHPMRDEIRFMHVRARVENAEALIRKGKPGEALKLLGDGPLPEGERGREAKDWIASTRADAEMRYWAGRLTAGSEARQAGQIDKARKILEDVVAHCSNQDILKLARQELAAVKVK